jgi:ubiquinol-cytochrome c reductase cytochrome c subunit
MRHVAAAAVALALVAAVTPAAAAQSPDPAQQGKALYGRYCVMCHGPNGSGISRESNVKVGGGPLRDQTVQQGAGPSLHGVGALAADFYLRTGYMPLKRIGLQPRRSRVVFEEGELRALIAYVASLGTGPPVPTPRPQRGNLAEGLRLFTDHCAGCHQVVAEGGYVTDVRVPVIKKDTPTQIAEAVRVGPNLMPKFSKKHISDRQLNSIIAYIQASKQPNDAGGWGIGHIGPVPEGIVTWFIAAIALVGLCVLIGERMRA